MFLAFLANREKNRYFRETLVDYEKKPSVSAGENRKIPLYSNIFGTGNSRK
jgi:hypothetical protein